MLVKPQHDLFYNKCTYWRNVIGYLARAKSFPCFENFRFPYFYDEIKLNKRNLVFKRLQWSCPAYMCDLIKFNADLHTRTGRYSKLNLAYLGFNRKAEGGKTLSVSASRFWNQLPINLKKEATVVLCLSERPFTDIFSTSYNEVEHFSPNAIKPDLSGMFKFI